MLPLAAALFAQGLTTAAIFAFIMHAIPAAHMGAQAAKKGRGLTLRDMLPIPDPDAPAFNNIPQVPAEQISELQA